MVPDDRGIDAPLTVDRESWLSNIEKQLKHEKLRVSFAQNQDSADVKSFIVEMLRRDSQELWSSEDLEEIETFYASNEGRFLVIRDAHGGVVGTGAYLKIDDRRVELRRLYLHPHLRGKGVAKLLILELIAEARAQGFINMRLTTAAACTEAIKLYQKLGFRITAEAPTENRIFFELELREVSASRPETPL